MPFFIVCHVQRHGVLLPSGHSSTCLSHSLVSYLTGSSITSSLIPDGEKYSRSKLCPALSPQEGLLDVRGEAPPSFSMAVVPKWEFSISMSSTSACAVRRSLFASSTLPGCGWPMLSPSESSSSDRLELSIGFREGTETKRPTRLTQRLQV